MAQTVKRLPTTQETGRNPWVGEIPWRRKRSPLQYSCLENPRVEEPARVQSAGRRVGHDWATSLSLRFISYPTFDTPKHLLLMGTCDLDRTVSSRPTARVSPRLRELRLFPTTQFCCYR